jgi:hypothetical protein
MKAVQSSLCWVPKRFLYLFMITLPDSIENGILLQKYMLVVTPEESSGDLLTRPN